MSDMPLLIFVHKLSTDKQNQSGWFKHFLGIMNIIGNFQNTLSVSLPILHQLK